MFLKFIPAYGYMIVLFVAVAWSGSSVASAEEVCESYSSGGQQHQITCDTRCVRGGSCSNSSSRRGWCCESDSAPSAGKGCVGGYWQPPDCQGRWYKCGTVC